MRREDPVSQRLQCLAFEATLLSLAGYDLRTHWATSAEGAFEEALIFMLRLNDV